METKEQACDKIASLKDGEHCYFNMFRDAAVYKCNGMYLLFEITQHGINESYKGTYSKKQIVSMVDKGLVSLDA